LARRKELPANRVETDRIGKERISIYFTGWTSWRRLVEKNYRRKTM